MNSQELDLTNASDTSAQPATHATSPLLPGFEPSSAPVTEETEGPSAETVEDPAPRDPFTPPPEADAPPLPGLTEAPIGRPPPVVHYTARNATSLELRPPAKKRAALAAQATQNAETRKPVIRFNTTVALAALSGVLGVGLIVACICLAISPEPPVANAPAGIPLALLPETADPALWEIVAGMSGEIDGVPLQFEHGLANGEGITYKVLLDFCSSGSDIYAKVAGEKTYVVRLDGQGRILKAYPAPKNNKPLKTLFSR